jgi:luciferase family oxidoreductase group 1
VTKLSVLDLMMIGEGKTFTDTLADAGMLARHVEQHGYQRYWIAEHHDMPGVASSATALLIGHLAAATSTLRVGAGGIMLPNHSPLMVAEQFATLATLHPGRIDLGLGRAAGAGGASVRALRGGAAPRDFEQDIGVLSDYLQDNGRQPVRGIPGRYDIPLWMLGSSTQSAELAARLGMPYVFASHFSPRLLMEAIALYRENFQPSEALKQPYVIAGVNAIAAESTEEAEFIASSHFQWVHRLYDGLPCPLPRPQDGYLQRLSDEERQGPGGTLGCTVVGDRQQVGAWLRQFVARTGAHELIVDARIHDPLARCRSYQIVKETMSETMSG